MKLLKVKSRNYNGKQYYKYRVNIPAEELKKADFKEAKVRHSFIITEIIAPKDEKDYSKIRELAKKKGRIVREAEIDGQKIKSEKES